MQRGLYNPCTFYTEADLIRNFFLTDKKCFSIYKIIYDTIYFISLTLEANVIEKITFTQGSHLASNS
jgi:hypothetical protein